MQFVKTWMYLSFWYVTTLKRIVIYQFLLHSTGLEQPLSWYKICMLPIKPEIGDLTRIYAINIFMLLRSVPWKRVCHESSNDESFESNFSRAEKSRYTHIQPNIWFFLYNYLEKSLENYTIKQRRKFWIKLQQSRRV